MMRFLSITIYITSMKLSIYNIFQVIDFYLQCLTLSNQRNDKVSFYYVMHALMSS